MAIPLNTALWGRLSLSSPVNTSSYLIRFPISRAVERQWLRGFSRLPYSEEEADGGGWLCSWTCTGTKDHLLWVSSDLTLFLSACAMRVSELTPGSHFNVWNQPSACLWPRQRVLGVHVIWPTRELGWEPEPVTEQVCSWLCLLCGSLRTCGGRGSTNVSADSCQSSWKQQKSMRGCERYQELQTRPESLNH